MDNGKRSRPSPILEVKKARERGDLDFLVRQLAHHDVRVRGVAARSIGLLGDPKGVKPLTRLLNAKDDFISSSAIRALERIGDTAAVPDLYDVAISSGPFAPRLSAALALATFRDERAPSLLSAILVDRDLEAQLRQPSTLPRLNRRVVKRVCAKRLIELDDPSVVAALQNGLADADFRDRLLLRKTIRALSRKS